MFLLPALGAWLSDSLILYIYFTNKGSGSGSNNGNVTLYDAARIQPCEHINFDNNSSIPCRFQDSSFERSKTNNKSNVKTNLGESSFYGNDPDDALSLSSEMQK